MLLFDLQPEMVSPVADAFARILRMRDARPVRRVVLGSVTGDDELWLRPVLRHENTGLGFSVAPGALVDTGADSTTLVVVPDLTRLSLPAMRGAVQLVGADVAVVERSGFRARWRPGAHWLAACGEAETGRLSPHLLDRFPVRLNVAGLRRMTGGSELMRGAAGDRAPELDCDELPPNWRAVLAAQGRPVCAVSEEAVDRAVELAGGATGGRRAIALARIARAQTVLAGADTCGPDEVEEAARLIGVVAQPVPPATEDSADHGSPLVSGSAGAPLFPELPRPDPASPENDSSGSAVAVPAGSAEALDAFPAVAGEGRDSAYPEDDTQFLREFHPLRIPWHRRPEPSSARGPVTGVRSATVLRDLAFVATVVEAAKYQNLPGRRALREQGDGRLVVLRGDFRSYARLPAPERMLVLLLDHTCRGGWDWRPALAPYVQWAYTGRASVCAVEIGSRDAADELRADHFVARSVLDPRVGAALQRPAGRSSPLAHGLAITDQLLRRAFQQRSNLIEAWLVVVSDGRGNIPLDASVSGRLLGPVRRAGVDDAMTAAGRIGAMGRLRLHAVVIDAGRQPYPDLPFLLADALGGVTVAGRSTALGDRNTQGAGRAD
ncbi:magnesium chelatase [Streptomyces sp. NPDC126522]|uniref:magnesium chelatase n=1 Tax=Streptomyces sp. NPDC126522 TaxID=3155211 RepID=UPI00331CD2FE